MGAVSVLKAGNAEIHDSILIQPCKSINKSINK